MANSIDKLRAKKSSRKKEADIDIYDAQLERPTLSNIQIDEELKGYIPPLKPEELEGLEESIRQEHVRDKLILWKDEHHAYILVDGHNRFHVLKKLYGEGLKINFQTEVVPFESREAVKDWMIDNQLSRRNLTLEQASYLRGLRYNREKARHGGSRKEASPQNEDLKNPEGLADSARKTQKASPQNEDLKTSHRLASEFKVGRATIERDGYYATGMEKIGAANPELKRAILSGDVKLSKTIIQNLSKFKGSKKSLKSIAGIKSVVSSPKSRTIDNDAFLEKKEVLLKAVKELRRNSDASSFEQAMQLLQELEQLR